MSSCFPSPPHPMPPLCSGCEPFNPATIHTEVNCTDTFPGWSCMILLNQKLKPDCTISGKRQDDMQQRRTELHAFAMVPSNRCLARLHLANMLFPALSIKARDHKKQTNELQFMRQEHMWTCCKSCTFEPAGTHSPLRLGLMLHLLTQINYSNWRVFIFLLFLVPLNIFWSYSPWFVWGLQLVTSKKGATDACRARRLFTASSTRSRSTTTRTLEQKLWCKAA